MLLLFQPSRDERDTRKCVILWRAGLPAPTDVMGWSESNMRWIFTSFSRNDFNYIRAEAAAYLSRTRPSCHRTRVRFLKSWKLRKETTKKLLSCSNSAQPQQQQLRHDVIFSHICFSPASLPDMKIYHLICCEFPSFPSLSSSRLYCSSCLSGDGIEHKSCKSYDLTSPTLPALEPSSKQREKILTPPHIDTIHCSPKCSEADSLCFNSFFMINSIPVRYDEKMDSRPTRPSFLRTEQS